LVHTLKLSEELEGGIGGTAVVGSTFKKEQCMLGTKEKVLSQNPQKVRISNVIRTLNDPRIPRLQSVGC
jgi:hypothetical protein